ncbi:MAG TPA: hypothetical protein VFW98_08005 [Gemmatimonadaceae bacterium]|nr:hypothetical protein [Gemmatimonadaceae bacterium]
MPFPFRATEPVRAIAPGIPAPEKPHRGEMVPARAVSASPRRRALVAAWVVTSFVVLSWPFAMSPLRNLSGAGLADGVRLVRPGAYIALAPVCDVLDALTLLSSRQTVVLIASLAILYAVWRAVAHRRAAPRARRIWREIALATGTLGAVIALYAVVAAAPRPMAALVATDPDLVIADFHSHTNASHDGRSGFTPSVNRAWHRAAGFNVAYITDHKTFRGAEYAARANPERAGDGVVLLSGVEYIRVHNHLNALGATVADFARLIAEARGATLPPLDSEHSAPVLIQTLPDHLALTPAPGRPGHLGVLGIELSDGSPRGIAQAHRDRTTILRIADSLDLAVVAGSDNHGWGRTAVAWSVLRIPNWRSLTPPALGAAIQRTIRTKRRHAVRVIARRSPDPGRSTLALAATLPAVATTMLTTLSPAERVSWLVWTWMLAGLALVSTRRPVASVHSR